MEEDFSLLSGAGKDLLLRLAITTGIGFLIGLEREFSKQIEEKGDLFAGVRTYPLFAVFGYLSAFLSLQYGPWLFGIALFCLVGLVTISYILSVKQGGGIGGTSEMSIIITFMLGALVFSGYILMALIITVIIMLLLTFKPTLHSFVKGLTHQEVRAFIQFIIISALVIPFLPDESFGPYDTWNLRDIWKMVILVSAISLAGYLLSKMLGNRGTILTGIVGGLASSTAVALSLSRQSKQNNSVPPAYFAIGIIAASTIMFPRVLLEVYALNRELFAYLWAPIALITGAGLITAWLLFRAHRNSGDHKGEMKLNNPLNFSTAIKFALIYAGILWLVKFSNEQFGASGTYIASVISGLTDVDAITISMAKMARSSEDHNMAANAILLAALSNTIVKFAIALTLGAAPLKKLVSIGYGVIFAAGLVYLGWKFIF